MTFQENLMEQKETTKEEIRELYDQILDKTSFQIKLAEKHKKEPITVRNHWFGQLMTIPKNLRLQVVEDIKEEIKNQKTNA